MQSNSLEHHQHPAQMNLFPTMGSVLEAIQHIEAQVPITSTNEMFSLLMMFNNTLLHEMGHEVYQVVILPDRTLTAL